MNNEEQNSLNHKPLTRFDILNLTVRYFNYDGKMDWLSIEEFLSKQLGCVCSDCGGKDLWGPCKIEQFFKKRIGTIPKIHMV